MIVLNTTLHSYPFKRAIASTQTSSKSAWIKTMAALTSAATATGDNHSAVVRGTAVKLE